MRKLLYVFNPIAGKGMLKDSLFTVVDTLTKQQYDVTVYPSQRAGDLPEKIAHITGYDLIVVAGGDGTLKEVVTGQLSSGNPCPIGYLPSGTTNDFANTLNLNKPLEKGLEIIKSGIPTPIDVGKFNEDYFVYVAAFGVFTGVAYETPQFRKNLLGHFAYVLEGITQLSQIKSYVCRITNGDEIIEGDFLFGMISNSDSVGGFKNFFGQETQLSDGLFEVCLIKKPKNLADLRKIIAKYINKEFDQEHMITFKTDRLSIYSIEPIHWTLDGEDGGITQFAEVTNVPSAVSILLENKK